MKFDECFFMYSANTWAGNKILRKKMREILAVVCRVSVRGHSANMGRLHGAVKCEQNGHVACYLPSARSLPNVFLHRCRVCYICRVLFGKYSASAQVCREYILFAKCFLGVSRQSCSMPSARRFICIRKTSEDSANTNFPVVQLRIY
jgi:hypothetical protein